MGGKVGWVTDRKIKVTGDRSVFILIRAMHRLQLVPNMKSNRVPGRVCTDNDDANETNLGFGMSVPCIYGSLVF